MAEKVLLNELMLSFGTDAPELPEELPLDEPLLPQAASTRAALPATAASPAFFVTENNENHLVHRPGRIQAGTRTTPQGGI
jgi:hypothetical protein